MLILAFIVAKESSNNHSLKSKKQPIQNCSSSVLQPFMAVIPLHEESIRFIRMLFYGQATIIIFCEPCEQFQSFHKPFRTVQLPICKIHQPIRTSGQPVCKIHQPVRMARQPICKIYQLVQTARQPVPKSQ